MQEITVRTGAFGSPTEQYAFTEVKVCFMNREAIFYEDGLGAVSIVLIDEGKVVRKESYITDFNNKALDNARDLKMRIIFTRHVGIGYDVALSSYHDGTLH